MVSGAVPSWPWFSKRKNCLSMGSRRSPNSAVFILYPESLLQIHCSPRILEQAMIQAPKPLSYSFTVAVGRRPWSKPRHKLYLRSDSNPQPTSPPHILSLDFASIPVLHSRPPLLPCPCKFLWDSSEPLLASNSWPCRSLWESLLSVWGLIPYPKLTEVWEVECLLLGFLEVIPSTVWTLALFLGEDTLVQSECWAWSWGLNILPFKRRIWEPASRPLSVCPDCNLSLHLCLVPMQWLDLSHLLTSQACRLCSPLFIAGPFSQGYPRTQQLCNSSSLMEMMAVGMLSGFA